MSIRQDILDTKLLEKFRTAMTPTMTEYLVTATNQLPGDLHPGSSKPWRQSADASRASWQT